MNSNKSVTRMIANINGMHSVMDWNLRLMESRFEYNVCNVYKVQEKKCDNESDADKSCVQIRELREQQDKPEWTFLEKGKCKSIIDILRMIKF